MQLIDGYGLDVVREEIRKSFSQAGVATAAMANLETASDSPLKDQPDVESNPATTEIISRLKKRLASAGHDDFVADVGRQVAVRWSMHTNVASFIATLNHLI